MNYFKYFPKIEYGNITNATDITRRVSVAKPAITNSANYYPYVIEDLDRVDNLSNDYYDDINYTWLIWLVNTVINPYDDFPKSENIFRKSVELRYGSLRLPQLAIKYWELASDKKLRTNEYNELPALEKRYFTKSNEIYTVRKDYIKLNTNAIFSAVTDSEILIGDILISENSHAEVIRSFEDGSVILKNVIGNGVYESLQNIRNAETVTFEDVRVLSKTEAFEEASYWRPVTYYEDEERQNDDKKLIKFLDPALKESALEQLKALVKV